MTKITQISAAVLLAAIASTTFTATAEARASKERCKQTGFSIFRTACDERIIRARFFVPQYKPRKGSQVNFRGRTNDELGLRSVNGGGEGGGGTGNGGRGGAGNGGGAAGGKP